MADSKISSPPPSYARALEMSLQVGKAQEQFQAKVANSPDGRVTQKDMLEFQDALQGETAACAMLELGRDFFEATPEQRKVLAAEAFNRRMAELAEEGQRALVRGLRNSL